MLAVMIAVLFVLVPMMTSASAFVPPEPTALAPRDQRHVAELTAEFCQSKVTPPQFTPVAGALGAPVPVLIYHRVTDADKPSREVISPALFRRHLQLIRELGYTTITASELTAYMLGGAPVPAKTVVLTFDDGWKDNLLAADELASLGMSGTFYIISGFLKDAGYVNAQDVLRLARNPRFEIGSHTHSHFIKYESKLHTLDLCTMAGEMAASKLVLEQLVQTRVQSIAWPYGYNTPEAVYVASRLGYTSTMMVNAESRNVPGRSPLEVQRLNVDGACPLEAFREMLQTGTLKECE